MVLKRHGLLVKGIEDSQRDRSFLFISSAGTRAQFAVSERRETSGRDEKEGGRRYDVTQRKAKKSNSKH
jgi:hypothetical protein